MVASPVRSPADRVRDKLIRWMELAHLSQRELAKELHRSQPWVVAIVTGQNDVRLKDLDTIAAALHTTASELVRGDEERHVLELTGAEVQLIERARRRPEAFAAICALLNVPGATVHPAPEPVPEPARAPLSGRKRSPADV